MNTATYKRNSAIVITICSILVVFLLTDLPIRGGSPLTVRPERVEEVLSWFDTLTTNGEKPVNSGI